MGKRFGGVGNAKLNERGEFLEEGEYELEIKRCSWFESRKKEEFYVVEFKVLESTNARHAAGLDRNWMPKMNQDTSDANLKGFIIACLGIDRTDKTAIEKVEDSLQDALAESLDDPTDPDCKNALKGIRVHASVKKTMTKPDAANPNGRPFNVHTFSPSQVKAAT